MTTMTIHDLEDDVASSHRAAAAQHGRSVEEEAREILRAALVKRGLAGSSLVASIRSRIEPLGGVELEICPRGEMRVAPALDA
jgi:plasmid stability protein